MRKYLEFRNASTILNSILLTIFGLIIGYATSKGLNLPFTAETLTTIATGIILLIFSYFNAKHQNTLFDEDTDTIYIPIDNLTDGQINAINNFINNAINANQKQLLDDMDLTGIDAELDDNDPAGEYIEE